MSKIRFGLCCIFHEVDINFRTTTVTHIKKLERSEALKKLSTLCLENARSLIQSLKYCKANGIGSFRINSRMCPVITHDEVGYEIKDLPDHEEIISTLRSAGDYAKDNNIRTSFHPDQFVVINSVKNDVVRQSLKEIEYHAELAELVQADVINIHAGTTKPNKSEALQLFENNFHKLSDRAKTRLTVENDDVSYTVRDLLPLCESLKIPLVYDIHHHRCNPDDLSCEEASDLAEKTWNREPLFHISSPLEGYGNVNERSHHDFIERKDFPQFWLNKKLTIDVEAKAKEVAVAKLINEIRDLTITAKAVT